MQCIHIQAYFFNFGIECSNSVGRRKANRTPTADEIYYRPSAIIYIQDGVVRGGRYPTLPAEA